AAEPDEPYSPGGHRAAAAEEYGARTAPDGRATVATGGENPRGAGGNVGHRNNPIPIRNTAGEDQRNDHSELRPRRHSAVKSRIVRYGRKRRSLDRAVRELVSAQGRFNHPLNAELRPRGCGADADVAGFAFGDDGIAKAASVSASPLRKLAGRAVTAYGCGA